MNVAAIEEPSRAEVEERRPVHGCGFIADVAATHPLPESDHTGPDGVHHVK